MDIYVLDGLNGIADIVDTFQSVIWNLQFFSLNDFELTVPGTKKYVETLQVGRLLVRDEDMSDDEYHNVMRIESKSLSFDAEKGWVLTVSGGGLKKILGQRIIWKQTNLSGLVETGIRHIITENIISPDNPARTIENFTLDTVQGFTDEFDAQLLGENIAEWLEGIGQTCGIGWDVYIKNGQYVFCLKKGTDRTYDQANTIPVVFSPEYDNLSSAVYTYQKADYKNAALIGGEGEGTAQRTAAIGDAEGLERFETYIDGGNVSSNGEIITVAQYTAMLEDYGREQLADTVLTEKTEGTIIPNGMYTLGKDYFLGDVVRIINDRGISATSRIIEIIYSEDENGSNLTPTFGDWEE